MLIRNKDDIGQLVKELRTAEKLNGTKFAAKVGTDQAVISRIEHGNTNVKLKTLLKIAKALGKRLYISIK